MPGNTPFPETLPLMKCPKSPIVADGIKRLRESKNYSEMERRIAAEVRASHAPALEAASLWRRLWLEMRISREIGKRLDREFPPGALFLVRGIR